MKNRGFLLNNDDGSVIIGALMVLALVTIIGFTSSRMSSTEVNISTNSLLYERAFYTAEAALGRAKVSLSAPYVNQNRAQLAGGGEGNWTFALDGSLDGYNGAMDDPNDNFPGIPIVWLIQQDNLNGVSYSVRVWDNNDDGDPTTDTDGLIFVRADALDPLRGGRCSIEELVEGTATGGSISGYTSQEGAGSGKSHTANDANAISDFSKQL